MKPSSGPFQVGDRVQLTGPKGRMNTITLESNGEFHTHRGVLRHDDLIGLPDGSVVQNSQGVEYLALRPLLADYVLSMPRGAAIVYPKDAAQILSDCDIFPGATVIEAGVGSGALSLHLLRAIGDHGRLFSFDRREAFASIAKANVIGFHGEEPNNWTVTIGDLQEALPNTIEPGTADRVVLDMLAPWECIDVVASALKAGGVLTCYVATVTQLSRITEEIRGTGLFTEPKSSETLVRGWHVEGLAVRPDHRMVAHTGFLVTARRLAPGSILPEVKRRASKSEFSDADLEAWSPELLGLREKSDRVLRKRRSDAERIAKARLSGNDDDMS